MAKGVKTEHGKAMLHNTEQAAYLQHVFNSCAGYNKGCTGCRWRLRCQQYYDQKV